MCHWYPFLVVNLAELLPYSQYFRFPFSGKCLQLTYRIKLDLLIQVARSVLLQTSIGLTGLITMQTFQLKYFEGLRFDNLIDGINKQAS